LGKNRVRAVFNLVIKSGAHGDQSKGHGGKKGERINPLTSTSGLQTVKNQTRQGEIGIGEGVKLSSMHAIRNKRRVVC